MPNLMLAPQIVESDFYTLNIIQNISQLTITMRLFIPIVNTSGIPQTHDILKKLLPGVYGGKCFNDDKFPFEKEVRATEVGHLFEHILLEYLFLEKVAAGYEDVVYDGETHWNWREDARGTFHISVTIGIGDGQILASALEKSVQLLNLILRSQIANPQTYN